MDITPKYIKMSEKATKLQEQWKPQEGDLVRSYEGKVFLAHHENDIDKNCDTCLFRQDQLQGMYLEISTNPCPYDTLQKLYEFAYEKPENKATPTLSCSIEELTLRFVMYELHKKVWNQEKEEWEDKTMTDKKMTSLEINRQEKPLQQLCMERLKQDARWGEQNHVGECYMRISKELHDAIKLNPLKSYEIAHRAGIHPATLSQIVSGITKIKSNDQRVIAVGRVLGIPPKDCFLEDREGN